MRARTIRSHLSAVVALAALTGAPIAIAAPAGHYVEHEISLKGLGSGEKSTWFDFPISGADCFGQLGPLHGHRWLLHPSGAGRFQISLSPRDLAFDDDGVYRAVTSDVIMTLRFDRGTVDFTGTATWSGAGLPWYYDAPDHDGEFSATLSVSSGTDAFEGASGTVNLRGHIDDLAQWDSLDVGPMRLDEIEGTVSVHVP